MDMLLDEHEGKIPWETLDLEELNVRFPRFLELREQHEIVRVKKKKKKGMDTIQVRFKSVDAETILMEEKVKKLPPTIKVSHLKIFCKKFFKVPPTEQMLLIQDGDGSNKNVMPTQMTQDQKPLSWYTGAEQCLICMQ